MKKLIRNYFLYIAEKPIEKAALAGAILFVALIIARIDSISLGEKALALIISAIKTSA